MEISLSPESTSWKPEVQVNGDPKWYDNALRFATKDEAIDYARDLFQRWTSTRSWRAAESDEPVNAVFENGKARPHA
jgi:hypothetical protein